MATVKNLDHIIAQAINRPRVDNIPLYARIDGVQDIDNKSEKWLLASKLTFTSPTNIRRLFITNDKVVIQLYKPVILNGKPDTQGTWKEIKLDGMLVDDRSWTTVYKGTGLGALSSPWVISNLEEIYFDWSILRSDVYRNSDLGVNELLVSYAQGQRGFLQSNVALNMFIMANGNNIKDMRNRFPRLRVIGLVSELSRVLSMKYDRGKTGLDSIEDSLKPWAAFEINTNLLKQSNSLMILNKLEDWVPNKFALRDGVYRFDKEILSPYFDDYTRRLQEYSKTAKTQVQLTQTNKPNTDDDDDDILVDLDDEIQLDTHKDNTDDDDILVDLDDEIQLDTHKTTPQPQQTSDLIGEYDERIHGGYRQQIEELILSVWKELYGNYADGKEIINGLVVPGGSILSTGESIKYQGILTLNTYKTEVIANTISNGIWEEFVGACRDFGINIVATVPESENEIKPFQYNPMLQRKIASGSINKEAYKKGWKEYEKFLLPYIENKVKELAIKRAKTGSDTETYNELSSYMISLVVINYKDKLGTQLRISTGDVSKTTVVAKRIVERLRRREQTHRSLAYGKLVLSDAIISEQGLTATITIYQNLVGYQAVPQFMGELLYNLNKGMFRPSLNNIIIGVDMKNDIVTAPFTKWLIPIIAGSRSGKGVLTLNMLLSVIGTGTPLFYLDGKPDMASLLWRLQDKYGIQKSMVFDGVGYKGVTDIDKKPYKAPYADNIVKMMASNTSDRILETNFGVLIYLKAMLVILLSLRYYKDQMGSPYGDIFVVFDEMYKIMRVQMASLVDSVNNALDKLGKNDIERKNDLNKILFWAKEIVNRYSGDDIGVFGSGIKAVALTQFAQSTQYNITGFKRAEELSKNFLLKRAVKIFGRQEGGVGEYGVSREKGDDLNYRLYNELFHFGIGGETGNAYSNLRTFKPLLVLNENDCKELTGGDKDGAFTADMINRISKYIDVQEFRSKYCNPNNRELAESIGFEGALAQVGRLLDVNWVDMLNLSLSRAYDIAEQALKYYGVIGRDNIQSVYDFITSFDIKHLWSYDEIITDKEKGLNTISNSSDTSGQSMFDIGDIDFGLDQSIQIKQPTYYNSAGGIFGGDIKGLNQEEHKLLRPEPDDEFSNNAEQVFRYVKNDIFVEPSRFNDAHKINSENSIDASLPDNNILESRAKFLFKNIVGANYEFSKRWDAVLDAISHKINNDLVTRVIIVKDAMYVNGRFVGMKNIIGGFANVRLEDIVDFKKMFKRFRNISELTLDTVMVERVQLEKSNLPIGFFEYSPKLLRVSILLENGSKEVINRGDKKISGVFTNSANRGQFDVISSIKTPWYKEIGVGYQSKVWNYTNRIGKKGWSSVKKQITKQNPSFVKATAIGALTAGFYILGATISGILKIPSIIKR